MQSEVTYHADSKFATQIVKVVRNLKLNKARNLTKLLIR